MRYGHSTAYRMAWTLLVCLALSGVMRGRELATAEQTAARLKTDAPTVTFKGTEFFHRWSENGQHEFTPKGDEDLKAWKDMVSVIVNDRVRSGDALADFANRVVGNYEANGHIMRTLSKPRTKTSEAEHFVAAVLQAPNVFEVAFARVLLFEGRGVVAVYSKRFYGNTAQADMTTWFKANAVPIEKVLLTWTGIPSLDVLKGLPQSRD